MDDPSPSLGRIAQLRAIAAQLRDFADDEARHFSTYRRRIDGGGRPERESTATSGAAQLRPHARDGHPVSGHTRSSPVH